MPMFLMLVVLCATVCPFSNVPRFQTVTGSDAFPEKSAKDEFMTSAEANIRCPDTFSRKKFIASKPEQTGRSLLASDNNISNIMDKKVDINGKGNHSQETMGKVPDVSDSEITNTMSQTNVPNNDTSVRFTSRPKVDNQFQKTNVNLNITTFGERDHQILDNQTRNETEELSSSLSYTRPRPGTGDQNNQAGLEAPSMSATWIPFTGSNNNKKQTSKSLDDYSNNACTCNVTSCDCSFLGLTKIPQNLATTITELILNNNSIEILQKDVLSRYQMLELLVLSKALIMTIQDGSFNGLTRLISLDLSNNGIGWNIYISERIFEPLKSLKRLKLDKNSFICSPKRLPFFNTLSYLTSVEELKIDYYGEGSFGPEYNNMTALRTLTLKCYYCFVKPFSNETFQHLSHITSLDISGCGIDGSTFATGTISQLTNLQTLDISYNRYLGMRNLPTILWSLRDSNLQTLKMSYIVSDYDITKVDNSLVKLLPHRLTTLVTRGNNIMFIDSDAVRNLPKSLKVIDLNGNNISEDPITLPLEELTGLETLFIHSGTDECLDNNKDYTVESLCDGLDFPESKGSKEDRFFDNGTSMMKREVKQYFFGRLKNVKLNVHDDNYVVFLSRISSNNNIEILDLSCSYLSWLSLTNLLYFPNLKCLNLRKSSVQQISRPHRDIAAMKVLILESNMLNNYLTDHGSLFSRFVNLSYLDISLNQLSFIRPDLLTGLDKLEYLRLDRNSFSVFDADISNMTQLKLLNFSNTGLSQLSGDVRAHIDQLCKVKPGQVRVDMSGCPIQCDCFNLDFLKWMVSSPAFDKNFTGYKCKYSDTSLKYIEDGYQETIHVLDRECAKNYPMFLIVLAATSVLIFAVMGSIVYRFRWKIRYLYYAAYLKVMDKRKIDNQHAFTYDVFISYDCEDTRFVCSFLSPELEERGLKLLIHSRDFVAGTYIASNIVMAVAESRKTLVVLTRNLLESTWCNYELQMANMEAVHTGRQVLVFLLKENIPSGELDIELVRHIRSNTYIPYPDPEEEGDADVMKRFYDKLAHDLRS